MWPTSEAEKEAIRELRISTTPDRIVAVLGGTFVESRLEGSLKSVMTQDNKVLGELFHTSGPLGPFATKIRLAYAIRMISKSTYDDMMYIKSVRNEFAHKIEAQSFARKDIAQWCLNLKIVETHIHERAKDQPNIHDQDISMFIEGKAEMLKKPRERFLYAVLLITEYFSFPFKLGESGGI